MCENDYIGVYVSLAGERTTMGRVSFAGARTTIWTCVYLFQVRERLCGRVSVAVARTTIWTCVYLLQVRERLCGRVCCRCENDYMDV